MYVPAIHCLLLSRSRFWVLRIYRGRGHVDSLSPWRWCRRRGQSKRKSGSRNDQVPCQDHRICQVGWSLKCGQDTRREARGALARKSDKIVQLSHERMSEWVSGRASGPNLWSQFQDSWTDIRWSSLVPLQDSFASFRSFVSKKRLLGFRILRPKIIRHRECCHLLIRQPSALKL